jgi:bacillopeptidase F
VVPFSEPVTGVSAASLALRLSGTTAALAGTLTCADSGGAAVGCAAGPVKTATLQPAAALVPGERYTVAANPAAASTIADVAGTRLAALATPFRAQTALQETTPAARYTWRVVTTSAAYGGSYRSEHLAGAAASYAFSGTSVTWYTVKGRSQGMADVYVDGVKKATVNNYASAASYKVARTVSGLAAGKHVLKVVVLGKKGSTSGTGTSVAVDAVKVGTTLSASPALTQAWRSSAATGPSGGAMAVADLAGQEVSLRFRGTSLSWSTSTGRNRGIAKVYVDGVLKMTTDLYAATTTYGVRRTVAGLTDARHTVRIVVTGTKRSAATGTYVPVDRFVIG